MLRTTASRRWRRCSSPRSQPGSGAVARTSTFALTNSTLRYALELANKGLERAVTDNPHLAEGVNTYRGQLTYRAVAEAQDRAYTPLAKALAS